VIDRSETQDTPLNPLAAKVAPMFGTRVAETILASVHVRAQQQAGHMDASDLIRALHKHPCWEAAVHIWIQRLHLLARGWVITLAIRYRSDNYFNCRLSRDAAIGSGARSPAISLARLFIADG